MNIGDVVFVKWGMSNPGVGGGYATIVKRLGIGFYQVLLSGEVRMMHIDFLEPVN